MRARSVVRLCIGTLLCTLSFTAVAENAVTSDAASVKAGPDSSYPEVAQLDADSPIQVMACLDDWSWCDVDFDGNRGWLYSPDITYEYDGGYVPLYSYAPALGVPVVSFSVDAYWGSYYHDRPWFSQRDQWMHRAIAHRRPAGPPPSSSPPPREAVRMERPHRGSQPDRAIRLGRADTPQREAQQHQGGTSNPEIKAEPGVLDSRPQDHSPPQNRAVTGHVATDRSAAQDHSPQAHSPEYDRAPHSAPSENSAENHSPQDHSSPERSSPPGQPQNTENPHTDSQNGAANSRPQDRSMPHRDDGRVRPSGRPEPEHHEEAPPREK